MTEHEANFYDRWFDRLYRFLARHRCDYVHIAATYDGDTGVTKLYVNGELVTGEESYSITTWGAK